MDRIISLNQKEGQSCLGWGLRPGVFGVFGLQKWATSLKHPFYRKRHISGYLLVGGVALVLVEKGAPYKKDNPILVDGFKETCNIRTRFFLEYLC